ncbi:LysR substrate-binding domain-containing protein [Neorhizobium galegae]|uniref:Transcriptional regulator, LysR family n=1 Tax=Neorhizobium galegae bv. orientalis str. HAMBI 540 TaxID=1028800 RepID=A0A068SP96_NEOGA|nr:LysR substrate-binding domain-containing protein [Neorhizobium galegae]MCQ1853779.1 LysR substrate-binding domain-containing protein [Neorhizobium galegae]CDN48127.1 Transcriptional regulator, LysR family [Neorhizobium galegae bv. orientalis str. HAMBI 540]
MEVKWLEDFLALAQTLNFSKAAEERHVTQSAFSRRIRQLETWVGASLIDRATYPSRLTDAGQRFVPIAEQTLQSLYQARRNLQHEEGNDARTVTVTALHTLSFTFFPNWLNALNAKLGPIVSHMRPDSGSMEENLNSLVDGDSDFLLTYQNEHVPMLLDPQFEHHRLGAEIIIPVTAPDANGQPRHRIEPGFAHVSYQKISFFGQLVAGAMADRLPPDNRVHVGSMSVGLKGMVMAGWGIAWIPESLVAAELSDGRLVRAAEPQWEIGVEIRLYRSKENRRPIVKRIWDVLAAG